jgi:hypothetical protein
MSNIFTAQMIDLDTFTSAIDFKSLIPSGIKVKYIEWSKPTAIEDTCTILLTPSGPPLIEWQATDVGERFINFYNGEHFEHLHIEAAGVGSGTVKIKI